jgi:hypothetical protein
VWRSAKMLGTGFEMRADSAKAPAMGMATADVRSIPDDRNCTVGLRHRCRVTRIGRRKVVCETWQLVSRQRAARPETRREARPFLKINMVKLHGSRNWCPFPKPDNGRPYSSMAKAASGGVTEVSDAGVACRAVLDKERR